MRLKNYTDIPDDAIRAIIKAVRPAGISNFDVRVSNCARRYGGRSYTQGSTFHDRACPFIVARIAKTDVQARCIMQNSTNLAYLPIAVGNRLELLVVVLAHELRHLWQAKVKRGWRVWGARGQFSERDANAYALRMLRRYRRGELLGE